MSNVLVLDHETESHVKGHVFHRDNYVIASGFLFNDEYVETQDKKVVEELYRESDIIVGFNLKFDLSWGRKTWDIWPDNQQIWDCQLAHFIINCQEGIYPSLNDALAFYNLPQKLDIVKTEYWDRGRLTSEVPKDLLSEYLEHDVRSTRLVYDKQKGHPKSRLIRQDSIDMLCLAEMEWNGMLYDRVGSLAEAKEVEKEIASLVVELDKLMGFPGVNWGSPGQLSAVLFGGEIANTTEEEYLFTYKDHKKPPVMKKRKVENTTTLPRLTKPAKETKKEGIFVVDEGTLSNLKATGKAKKIIDLYLKRQGLAKLVGTYLLGIPRLFDTKGWEGDYIHGSLNQVKAVTGRLSSNDPNLQNQSPLVKKYFISRY